MKLKKSAEAQPQRQEEDEQKERSEGGKRQRNKEGGMRTRRAGDMRHNKNTRDRDTRDLHFKEAWLAGLVRDFLLGGREDREGHPTFSFLEGRTFVFICNLNTFPLSCKCKVDHEENSHRFTPSK